MDQQLKKYQEKELTQLIEMVSNVPPEPNFVGKATPVKVVRKDKNGKTIKASYTPTAVRPDTKFVVVGKDGKETEIIPSKDGKNHQKNLRIQTC